MPTRTRPRKKPAAEAVQEDFYPDQIAGQIQQPEFEEDERPTEEAPLDEEDDGTISPDPIDEDDDGDPSAGQPLGKTTAGMTMGQQAAAAELADYMRRMSNLITERNDVNADIKELKSEIKGKGYDLKAFDLILKIDSMDDSQKSARREQNSVNATYAHAVGIDEDLL